MSITNAVFSTKPELVDLLHTFIEEQLIETNMIHGSEIVILKKVEKKEGKLIITFQDNSQMELILKTL